MTTRRAVVVRVGALGVVTVLGVLPTACGDDGDSADGAEGGGDVSAGTTDAAPAAVIDPGDEGNYQPSLAPDDVVAVIDNPYLPLQPGMSWAYEGESDGERERVEVVVTDQRREVMGIPAVVVRDTATVEGEVVEETDDWFAQDRDGNVWYLGESTTAYEDGAASEEGSWEAGVDGALPGIVMPADPQVGDAYRQEYLAGEAEDMGEVVALGRSVEVPTGPYEDVLVTRDWTPLEPETVEEKEYAPGVGLVRETQTAGGEGTLELVAHAPAS